MKSRGQSLTLFGLLLLLVLSLWKLKTRDPYPEHDNPNIDWSRTEKQKEAILTMASPKTVARKFRTLQYKVQKGDTWENLTERFSITKEAIVSLSGIRWESKLVPGQILQIPNRPGFVYRFKRGDNLNSVLEKYSANWEEVLLANELEDSDLIPVGKLLLLPSQPNPSKPSLWRIPLATGLITSGFGYRTFPRSQFHLGLDLRANFDLVYPVKTGQVIFAGLLGGYGYTVVLRHDSEFQTLYAHNSKLFVRLGETVYPQDSIARSGCTGNCYGPHLHFELIRNGSSVDPTKYIGGFLWK